MSANMHLLTIPDGDTKTKVRLKIKNHAIRTSRSDRVLDGCYLARVQTARWANKAKGKAGKNLALAFSIEEPSEYAGLNLLSFIPAPQGDENQIAQGEQRMKDLAVSIASVQGPDALDKLVAREEVELAPDNFKNKVCVIHVRAQKGSELPDVQFGYKNQYDAHPGPVASIVPGTPAGGNGTQVDEPEILLGGSESIVSAAQSAASAAAQQEEELPF